MLDPKRINEFVDQVVKSLPEGLKSLPQDMRNNLRAVLQDRFAKLDLVTREEFDTQAKVLARTRERLDALTQQVADLEKSE